MLASRLKIPRITVIELGVAGGRGLIALEQASLQIESAVGVQIDVVGFVSFDLDYYSSTKTSLQLFSGSDSSHLPRVHCCFDDLSGNNLSCMNEFVGEHLAIKEFNELYPDRKVCKIEQLRLARPRWEKWQSRMYAFHNFSHPAYNTLVIPRTTLDSQLPLA